MSPLFVHVPPELWLTSNRPIRSHAHRARVVRSLHELAWASARSQRLARIDGPVHAVWTIRYPKGTGWTHGDAANAHPTCKALLDGLVESRYLPGDGPRHVRAETYRRAVNHDRPSIHVVELALRPAYDPQEDQP